MNMVFPKNEMILINNIKSFYESEDFKNIVKLKEDILLNKEFINNHFKECFDILIKSLFNLRRFDEVINLFDELFKFNIETYDMDFYTLLSLLESNDINKAMKYTYRLNLLKEYEEYLNIDEVNYYEIFSLDEDKLNKVGPLLILINFIYELFEAKDEIKKDNQYIFLRSFDLLNMFNENNISPIINQKFLESIEIMYEIHIPNT